MSGYFGIGIFHGKNDVNVGTLWRSAYQLGASFVYTVGRRYSPQASDTSKTWRNIPCFHFATWEDLLAAIPFRAELIGIEMGGKPLQTFQHPRTAIYMLGAEDRGINDEMLAKCSRVIEIPTVRQASFNVAVAGSIVMAHRHMQMLMPKPYWDSASDSLMYHDPDIPAADLEWIRSLEE